MDWVEDKTPRVRYNGEEQNSKKGKERAKSRDANDSLKNAAGASSSKNSESRPREPRRNDGTSSSAKKSRRSGSAR